MRYADIIMLRSKPFKMLFVKAFIMECFAASNTGIAFQFGRFWVDSVARVAIMSRASKLLRCWIDVFYYFSTLIWKFTNKSFREQTRDMIKFVAIAWKWAFVDCVLVLDRLDCLFLWFWFLGFKRSLLLMIVSFFKTNRTREPIYFLLAVETLRIM